MKNLKRLTLSFALVCALVTTTLAGETNCPPLPPCVPGETQSPPCQAQSVDDESAALAETSTPSAEPVLDVTDIAETLLWSLLLF